MIGVKRVRHVNTHAPKSYIKKVLYLQTKYTDDERLRWIYRLCKKELKTRLMSGIKLQMSNCIAIAKTKVKAT